MKLPQILNFQKGFTLIEILIVIAIIGILASIGLNVYPQSQKQARDQQRKSDLRQYQAAIEAYANANNGNFPSLPGYPAVHLCLTAIDLDGYGYIASCPEDVKTPVDSSFRYRYDSDGTASTATATKYIIYAKLESASNTHFVICSNGKVGDYIGDAVPNNNGACPI